MILPGWIAIVGSILRQFAAGRTRHFQNLGMRFSNQCGVRMNLRRMDRLMSMIIVVGNKPYGTSDYFGNAPTGERNGNINAHCIHRNLPPAGRGLSADPGEAAAARARGFARSARCARNS